MPDKMTAAEFAARIKQRDPRLASVPDDELVKKVLERRPDMQAFLAPAGPSPEAQEQAKKTPFALTTGIEPTPGGVAGYETKELFGGAWDALKGLFGLVKPPETTTEKVAGGLFPPAVPLKRMAEGIIEPITHVREVPAAISDLRKSGVAGPALALQVPRTMGNVAASYELGRIMQPGYKSAVGGAAKGATRVAAQELAGAGREPVLQARIRYEQALEDYKSAAAEKRADYATKVAEARKEWVDKAMEAKRGQAEAASNQARRETLTKGQEAYADRLQKNIKQTFQAVKSRLDSRWHGLRTTPIKRGAALTILKDEPLSSPVIAETVEIAEKKFLQGAPESLKQFHDLMNWMREDTPASVDVVGGVKPKLRPITWDEARTHYSALGDRMYSGDLPGNMVQAIRFVRDEGLGKQLRAGAERAGALPQYESLLHDWSRFESDWKDMSSVTRGGGSPLAIALKAPNAATLISQVTSKTGDLLIERLARYKEQGASPATAAAVRRMEQQIKAVPKVKAPEEPASLKLPHAPKEGKPPSPVDPVAIRRAKLLERAAQRPSWWDILFPPSGIEHAMLKSPAIREWIAQQARKETPVP